MSTADNTAVAATASSKSAAGGKEESQGSAGNRKTASSRPPEQALKCPRCDSPNTKFCYYNNYSLTQPRHFCKTCRRYWTKGGALRNVPVGGGCRKNKKVKSSSRLIAGAGGAADSKDSSSSSSDHHFGPVGLNLKFFHGISPAMDFQLGGLNSFPSGRLQNPASTTGTVLYNPLSSSAFGDNSLPSNNSNNSSANLMMGSFDYPLSLGSGSNINAVSSTGNVHSSLASSIESLSSINQDLHWKLQQQRLAMLFGADNSQKDTQTSTSGGAGMINSSILNPLATTAMTTTNQKFSHHVQQQQQQHQTVPILFQNLEISKADHDHSQQVQARKEVTSSGDQTASNMGWFFGSNSYGQQAQHHHVTAAAQTPTDSGSNGNENLTPWNSNIGVQAWSTAHDLHQFSALP